MRTTTTLSCFFGGLCLPWRPESTTLWPSHWGMSPCFLQAWWSQRWRELLPGLPKAELAVPASPIPNSQCKDAWKAAGATACMWSLLEAQGFSRIGEFIDPWHHLVICKHAWKNIFGPLLNISVWKSILPNGLICAALQALLPDALKTAWGIFICNSH